MPADNSCKLFTVISIEFRINSFGEELFGFVVDQAFHLEDLGLFPGQSMRDVWSTECHRGNFSPINWAFNYSAYTPHSLMYRLEY
jgi:hypothetical protein